SGLTKETSRCHRRGDVLDRGPERPEDALRTTSIPRAQSSGKDWLQPLWRSIDAYSNAGGCGSLDDPRRGRRGPVRSAEAGTRDRPRREARVLLAGREVDLRGQ